MKSLMYYIRPYLPILCLQFFIKFTGTIMDLLLPWLLSYIIDDVVPTNNIKSVYFYGGLMVFFTLVGVTFNIVANRISIKTSRNITEKYRHDLFEKTAYLSSRSTDRFTIPSLISRLTSDTYNVHMMIDRMQRLGVRAPILLLGGIAVTMTLEPVFTGVLICTLPILAAVVFYVSKKGIGLYTQTQEATDGLVRKVQENMTGVRVIKALSKSDYEKRKFDETNIDLIQKDRKAQNLMAITNPTMNLLLNLGLTAVVVIGAYRVNAGVSQPGKIIAFLSYFAIILNALLMVTRLFVIYSKGAASAKRIAEVLETPSETDFKPLETALKPHFNASKPSSNGPQIEFNNVCFSYNGVRDNLSDISFTLMRGETLGIIGPTGSGKTTVINLLLRFYDADSGGIKIGGQDIKDIPREILHTKFGVVFQNDFLYADTIRENIDFGRSLDDGDIINAARAAQADFIYNKEGSFAHRLNVKGANLSGGQKQRLLIARALAANPEILILDDCSSGLDYLTDAALRKALHGGFKDTTKVIIAQRISSIMNADKIMVLDDGKIIGCGTHAELLSSCESYREIYGAQMAEIG